MTMNLAAITVVDNTMDSVSGIQIKWTPKKENALVKKLSSHALIIAITKPLVRKDPLVNGSKELAPEVPAKLSLIQLIRETLSPKRDDLIFRFDIEKLDMESAYLYLRF